MKALHAAIAFAGVLAAWSGQVSGQAPAQAVSPPAPGASTGVTTAPAEPLLPTSDPTNEGGWVLNTDLSDEFNGTRIDHDKWLVQGFDGDYYIWKGRPPSQYAPHNVIVEDGFLKIRSQWGTRLSICRRILRRWRQQRPLR